MLHLIPAPAHRAVLRLAHGARRRWWRLRGSRVAGCRVLALDAAGRVLLVRHSYGSDHWTPPGGGLARGEDAVAAGVRELLEETGCRLTGAQLLKAVDEPLHGAVNRVNIVAGHTIDQPVADQREIIEAAFFALDVLPEHMWPKLREQLPGWVTAATAGHPADAGAVPSRPPAPKA